MVEKYIPNFSYSLRMLWDRRRVLRRLHGFRWRMFSNANPGIAGRIRMIRALAMWPVRLLPLAIRYLGECGRDVALTHGVPK